MFYGNIECDKIGCGNVIYATVNLICTVHKYSKATITIYVY